MLLTHPQPTPIDGSGIRVAIVAAEYNARYVDGMLSAALELLKQSGATGEIFRVPGAFEIPVMAAVLLRGTKTRPDAVICLGVIWQGETDHARQVAGAVTTALMGLQVETGVPCVHEVLTVTNDAQAHARCLEPQTNRGREAATTALRMAGLLKGQGVGF
jgi:6,7-dimethyl-8-ribityllumazine synthase